jgi:ParB family chromosome partitioning protein
MAAAIVENAEALQQRKSAAEVIREENDTLAHEYIALREAGQVVASIAIDQVHSTVMIRDRLEGDDPELQDLVTSIRDLGLSNPIRVMQWPDGGGYELIQGFRRLSAYQALAQETGDAMWREIPALVMKGDYDVAGLYRRMVDENVIRKDLSFAEMAFAAANFANDPKTEAKDVGEAVAALYQSAAYSKRSYIRNFAFLLDEIGPSLKFPTYIPRALGVSLARAIKGNEDLAAAIAAALVANPNRDADQELGLLGKFAKPGEAASAPDAAPKSSGAGRRASTKTTFHIGSTAGQVKCTAAQGRLEIKVDRDFSAIDRARLEQAVADLIDGLA